MLQSEQLRYLRLRQAHPDMTPADAHELAQQQLEDEQPAPSLLEQAPKPELPAAGGTPPGMSADELDPYQEPPTPPPAVQASGLPEEERAPVIDEKANARALAGAEEGDRRSKFLAAMELAGRQLVAGLTRTEVGQGVGAAPEEAPGVAKAQQSKRDQLREYLARKRQGGLDASTKALQESETAKNYAEAMKAKLGKPAGDGPESLRALLLSPVYAGALKKKGMTPEAVQALGEAGLKDLVAQLKTDTTNEATVQAGRESAGINATRALANAKDLKEWESNLPKNMPPEFVDQLEGLKGSEAAIAQLEQNLQKVDSLGGKIGASGIPGAAQGLLGSGPEQGATFEADSERTAIALARGLEGGMARPGNVEIIKKIMPHPTDSKVVKETRLKELRQFMENKKTAFAEAMKGGNYKPVDNPPAPAGPSSGMVRVTNGKETYVIPRADLEAAKKDGFHP